MATKTTKIQPLPSGSPLEAGHYDNAKRWYPEEQFIVPGSFRVRSPSRAWPYNYIKHFYTRKYSQLLFYSKPLEWMRLQGIDPKSDEGKGLIAHYSALRLQGRIKKAR
jgi:hypothetical protein